MGARLKMKDLEAATGVSREAIRYYIREGMLPEPERPRRNVAYYSDEHVLRIRAIKRLQAEQFLPLAAIRDLMRNADVRALAEGRGEEIAALMPTMLGDEPERRSLSAVLAASGLARTELDALVRRGIVAVAEDDTIDSRDAEIVHIWGRVRDAGYRDEDGFDLDHLQRYQDLATWLAGVEVDLFLATLATRHSDTDAARKGAQGLLLANELIGAMHIRAAIAALRGAANGTRPAREETD